MMKAKGYFLVTRGWRNHSVFKDESLTEREAWLWLVENAKFVDCEVWIKGRLYPIPRGHLAVSYRLLKETFGWSQIRLYGYLQRLKTAKFIELLSPPLPHPIAVKAGIDTTLCASAGTHPGTPFTFIRLRNYEFEQTLTGTQTDTQNNTVSDTRTDTNTKKVMNHEKGKRELIAVAGKSNPNRSLSGERLETFLKRTQQTNIPPVWGNWAAQNFSWPMHRVLLVWSQFCDYWRGAAGPKANKCDWEATWRNWVRNDNTRHSLAHNRYLTTGEKNSLGALKRDAILDSLYGPAGGDTGKPACFQAANGAPSAEDRGDSERFDEPIDVTPYQTH